MVTISVVARNILCHFPTKKTGRSVDIGFMFRSMTCALASVASQTRFDEYRDGFGQINLGDNKPYIIGKYTT